MLRKKFLENDYENVPRNAKSQFCVHLQEAKVSATRLLSISTVLTAVSQIKESKRWAPLSV